MSNNAPAPNTLMCKTFSFDCARAAGTYNMLTATGDVFLKSVTIFTTVKVVGTSTIGIFTDNTTADTILNGVIVSQYNAGKRMGGTSTVYLPSGKHIQYVSTGTGTAGTLLVLVEYYPLTASSDLV